VARRAIDPARRPFELEEVADRSLVGDDDARLARFGVLGAILLVSKHGRVTQSGEYGPHGFRIVEFRLELRAGFVGAGQPRALEGEDVAIAGLPQSQQVALPPEREIAGIEQSVALEDAPLGDPPAFAPQ